MRHVQYYVKLLFPFWFLGSNHSFSYLDSIEPNLKNSEINKCTVNPNLEASSEEHANDDLENTDTTIKIEPKSTVGNGDTNDATNSVSKEAVKPSSWASLFKSADAPQATFSNDVTTTAPGILSIQMEQEKESKQDDTKTHQNSVTLISMSNDDRALALAGILIALRGFVCCCRYSLKAKWNRLLCCGVLIFHVVAFQNISANSLPTTIGIICSCVVWSIEEIGAT